MLAECAQRLWDETVRPVTSGLQLPVRGYHRIKELSLSPSACIEPGYTHVIVDEAHDLPLPMAQFLDRCPLPVITLGDSCQRLDGAVAERAPHVRRREIFHSLRAGHEMEGAVHALIENNPVVHVHPLEGNRQQDTWVIYYPTDRLSIPEDPTTILVWSEWGLFEWFQRLANAWARFSLLPGCAQGFRLTLLVRFIHPYISERTLLSIWTLSVSGKLDGPMDTEKAKLIVRKSPSSWCWRSGISDWELVHLVS